jgi:hypothetical protein
MLIAIQSPYSARYQYLQNELKRFAGDDCKVLDNLFFIRTQANLAEVHNFLSKYPVNPEERIVAIPIGDTWLAFNAPGEGDCVEYTTSTSAAG